jgi:hypothetical protein
VGCIEEGDTQAEFVPTEFVPTEDYGSALGAPISTVNVRITKDVVVDESDERYVLTATGCQK